MGYRVEIKPSARRTNGAVGQAVQSDGRVRVHEDRAAADEWASDLTERGERRVWIQDAPPHDRTPNDGYLVARGRVRAAVAPFESDQRELRADPNERSPPDGDNGAATAATPSTRESRAIAPQSRVVRRG